MARIGATLSGFELRLVNRLAEANAGLALHNLRLVTGRKINDPQDDPAGYVEIAGLESQRSAVGQALANVTAASAVGAKAQLVLGEIGEQLSAIRAALVADENQSLNAEQRQAKQASIDEALDEIGQLAAESAAGHALFDGSSDFAVTGRNANQVSRLTVYSLPVGGTKDIAAEVTTAATQATLTYTGAAGLTTAAANLTLTGARGSAVISVNNAEALTVLRDRINLESHHTGVTASVNGNALRFSSVDYGTQAQAQIAVNSGTFAFTGGDAQGAAYGVDGEATINGRTVTGRGNRFVVSDNGFSFALETTGGVTGAIDTLHVAPGGSRVFQLGTTARRSAVIGLPNLMPHALGGLSGRLDQLLSGGSLSGLATNTSAAIRVVDEAIGQVQAAGGRVEGFVNATLGASSSLLTAWDEDLGDTIDALDKADEEAETLLIAKHQALADNAVSGLSILASQRSDLVMLIRQIAGLG
ncbi:MAG: hypothetical protein K1X74_10030 [Pirellulales bacterium]|nr:hypothetical protein [Pirellulales bacterium]